MGTLIIQTAPGAEVRAEQLRHEFWFGAALANQFFGARSDAASAAKYKQVFLENFNAAVTGNALKWHSMEPRQGEVDYSVVDAMLARTRDLMFKEWWTTWQGKADAQGRCEVRAFFGRHRVTFEGREMIVELRRKEPTTRVRQP
jgi:GH35 family endo-1,4-beta-xylanase